MKKSIFLTVLLFGLITQQSNAQWIYTGPSPTGATNPTILENNSTLAPIYFGTNSTDQMTLTTSGFLGIGAGFSTPTSLLDVDGGDIDVLKPTNGYMIGGSTNYVLWTGSAGGTDNTMVGLTKANPIGNDNTLVGYLAGNVLGSGAANTFIGSNAAQVNSAGGYNTAVGCDALYSNAGCSGNTAVGDSALYSITGAQPTGNVAIGNSALRSTTGSAISFNTSVGEWSMRHNSTGGYNTALGFLALYGNTSGNSNVAIGYRALYSNGATYGNTAIGNNAGTYNVAGLNTFLGDSAGWGCRGNSDTNDVFIGWQSGPAAGAISPNYVYIGSAFTTHISSAMAIITTWSDRRLKDDIQANVPGLAFITKLTPVTYHYNLNKAHELLGTKGSSSGKAEVEQITQSGFIAQQVDSAAQACGYDFSGVVKPKTPNGAYALGYTEFVVPLVKAVQELNAKNDSLNAKNNSLNSTVDSLRSAFNNMQACLNQICAATGNSNVNSNPAGEQNVTLNSANSPILYQNSPNPFNTGTKINYFLPEGTMGATIVFYDSYGNQIKTIALSETGNGTLNVTSDNLTNGIYAYSLIVNGTVIDTKKMVLQK